MLIVSNFHDYYDVMMKHGVDKAVVYQRKEEKISFREDSRLKLSDFPIIERLHKEARMYLSWGARRGPYDYIPHWYIVGVCGRLLPMICLQREIHTWKDSRPEVFFAYSLASLVAFARKYFPKKGQERFFEEPDRFRKKDSPMRQFDHLGAHTFFDTLYGREDINFFRKINAPIGIYCDDPRYNEVNLTINPKLAEYDFQKIMDPHTIYQELAMFISGVLGVGSPETVKISDRDMAAKKGFDDRSFRTDPGTRKPRWLKRQLRDK